eukprot:9216042-Alexandrium_andersonii.AAC.1
MASPTTRSRRTTSWPVFSSVAQRAQRAAAPDRCLRPLLRRPPSPRPRPPPARWARRRGRPSRRRGTR